MTLSTFINAKEKIISNFISYFMTILAALDVLRLDSDSNEVYKTAVVLVAVLEFAPLTALGDKLKLQ